MERRSPATTYTKLQSCHCEARPGVTEVGSCPEEKNPVWARDATGSKQVVSSINPVWAREQSDVAIYAIEIASLR